MAAEVDDASPDAPRLLPLGTTEAVVAAYPALRALLHGRGPLLVPTDGRVADPAAATPAGPTLYLRDVTGVAVGTSGSTGAPKRAVLPADALCASIEATHERLGGPGRWLLALPARHIAGLQVVLRSLAAGAEPVLLPDGTPFPAGLVAAVADLSSVPGRWYTSLVPAQLGPLLDDPGATAVLRRAAGVLCGGGALPEPLRARAEAAGIALVTTYGMSETAGGCVYDGTPIPGVRVRVEPDGAIRLGGPTVAAGYLDDPDRSARSFRTDADGTRWFGTDDLGALTADGALAVHGRRDDVINSGGYKVHPGVVETALAALLPPGSQLAVVGVPHPRWGQAVVAAYVPPHAERADRAARAAPVDRTDELRPALRATLPRYAVPHRIVQLPALPLIGPGKVERAALARELGALDAAAPRRVEQ